MINYETKRIEIPDNSGLTGGQIFQLVEQEMSKIIVNGKLPEGKEHPYELKNVKIGGASGQEPIQVGTSVVILQRIQLKEGWDIAVVKPQEQPDPTTDPQPEPETD